jgi:iron complex transport system ATP-binding protein
MIASRGLEIEGLTAGYRKRNVISDLTLPEIKVGEVTALVGPNAAGKSTLLRTLAGLLHAHGNIRLHGDNILAMTSVQRARLVSMMPQSLPQGIALNVLEGVITAIKGGAPSGFDSTSGDVLGRAMAGLERLGIADLALEPLDHLSGGQRQLASLAQVIVREPSLLLLDEPTSALDLRHQVEVMNFIHDFALEGRIVVVVLHDLNLAMRWADRIVLLHHGEVHAFGDPIVTITPETLRDVYSVKGSVERNSNGYLQVIVG